jgi:8-oxo-dGTP diphosphatase
MSTPTNPFETGTRSVIPAVLIYLRAGDEILMIHKNKGSPDLNAHYSKWNGLGGKLEALESPLDAAARETFEESGIRVRPQDFSALGTLYFPDFKAPPKSARPEDWSVWVYTAQVSRESLIERESDEGTLAWVKDRELLSLNLWPGDRYFLPFVIQRQPFSGTIWYRDGNVIRQEIRKIEG